MLHFFSESLEVSVKDNKICHLVFTDVVSFMACVKKGENIYNGKRKIGKKVIKKKKQIRITPFYIVSNVSNFF